MHSICRLSQGRQAAPAVQHLPLQSRQHISFNGSTQLQTRSRALSSSSSRHIKTAGHACPRPILQQLHTLHTSSRAASAAAPLQQVTAADDARAVRLAATVVVIGGGPAGLCTALMLARRGYSNVKVFERLPEPPAPDDLSVWGNFEQASERLYMIGLNGRGQTVLQRLGVIDRIDAASSIVLGRLDWQPDSAPDNPQPTYHTTRKYKTRCLQRDRLASCLLQELREKHAGAASVSFGARCVGVQWRQGSAGGQEVCQLTFQRQPSSSSSTGSTTSTISATASSSSSSLPSSTLGSEPLATEWVEESSFVVGADGAGSSLRSAMESSSSTPLTVKRFQDKKTIVYRTIPLFWPEELAGSRPGNLNYSARTKSGINLDCLPTKEGPFIGVMLYKPGDKRVTGLKTAEDVRALFQQHFPAFLPAVREVDLQRFADKADCSLPSFSYAGPVLHYGRSACLVGDAIHTVKPYFGQGVNSAFEDVAVLEKALEEAEDDAGAAVQRYSQLRAKDAEALVVLSHTCDGGFLSFVGPLILDSMLHKLLPRLFSPNIIASLQNEQWGFAQIRARKRWDRALQVGLLAAAAAVLVRVVAALLGLASKLLSRVGAA